MAADPELKKAAEREFAHELDRYMAEWEDTLRRRCEDEEDDEDDEEDDRP